MAEASLEEQLQEVRKQNTELAEEVTSLRKENDRMRAELESQVARLAESYRLRAQAALRTASTTGHLAYRSQVNLEKKLIQVEIIKEEATPNDESEQSAIAYRQREIEMFKADLDEGLRTYLRQIGELSGIDPAIISECGEGWRKRLIEEGLQGQARTVDAILAHIRSYREGTIGSPGELLEGITNAVDFEPPNEAEAEGEGEGTLPAAAESGEDGDGDGG